jgi:hypothetical protein
VSIEAYDYGKKDGIAEERKRILDWVKDNRSQFELVEGHYFYRDHFQSEDLIAFIETNKTEEKKDE